MQAIHEPEISLRHCGGDALVAIVTACMEHEVPLRATVRNAAVTHRAEFTPRSLVPTDGWWFASDDMAGLHFQPEMFGRIVVEHPSRSGDGASAVIHASLEKDIIGLVLEAGVKADVETWESLIETIF